MNKLLVGLGIAAGLMSTSAFAEVSETCRESLSGRSATMLVGARAGGGYDVYARAITPIVAEMTGMRMRVLNNEAGGGTVARSLASSATEDDLVLLFGSAIQLALENSDGESENSALLDFDSLGLVHSEPNTWVAGADVNILDPELAHLVASQVNVEGGLFRIALVGRALGIETSIVGGYGGSSDMMSAILRGEVDITSMSLDGSRRLSDGNETQVALILSGAPDPNFPNVPHLAGEGGAVEIRGQGISATELAERERYARIALALSGSDRGIFAAHSISAETRDCLREAVEAAYASDELTTTMAVQGRPVAPIVGEEAQARRESLIAAYVDSLALIGDLLREQQGN